MLETSAKLPFEMGVYALPERPASPKGRAWIEVNMENLRRNTAVLSALLPRGCQLMPAVKANAYGHGAVLVARELNRLGIRAFCVATAEEGAELRLGGVRGTILVLGYTPEERLCLVERCGLTQTVVDYQYAVLLNRRGRSIRVHIGIDTGMHRLGEPYGNLDQIRKMFLMENLKVGGVFTHLCAGDTDCQRDQAFTRRQGRAFDQVVRQLRESGIPCPKAHILSSYGLLNYPELGGDYARVGIALYGLLSTRQDTERCQVPLRPVLSVKARVASVKALHPGESAGYGLAFTADKEMRTAALSIGYADGLPRALSGGVGGVLIAGRFAPVIGRICMDQTLVDVTEIPAVQAGDVAVVIGESGDLSISACDLAGQTGTISNEILSRLGTRLERFAVRGEASFLLGKKL